MRSANKLGLLGAGMLLLAGCAALERAAHGDWAGATVEVAKSVTTGVKALEDSKVDENYTPSEEYYIGRGTSAVVIQSYPAADMSSPKGKAQLVYMNEMGGYMREATLEVTRDWRKLGEHNSRDEKAIERINNQSLWKGLHVGLLDSNEVCAFATPGGFIWVSRGAVLLCANEDELAAIICHELGHVVLNHGIDAYREANQNQILSSGASKALFGESGSIGSIFGNMVVGLAEQVITSGYNKDQEFEADNWGTRALAASGYDPRAMVAMLKRVQEYERLNAEKGKYLSNHPSVEARIEEVEKVLKTAKLQANPSASQGAATRNQRFVDTFKK